MWSPEKLDILQRTYWTYVVQANGSVLARPHRSVEKLNGYFAMAVGTADHFEGGVCVGRTLEPQTATWIEKFLINKGFSQICIKPISEA